MLLIKRQKTSFSQSVWHMKILATIIVIYGLSAGGCQQARMPIPRELSGAATEMPVRGRKPFKFDESFEFGRYRIEEVRRGWTESSMLDLFGFKKTDKSQKFEFILTTDEERWHCNCSTQVNHYALDLEVFLGIKDFVLNLRERTSFFCNIQQQSGPGRWILAMGEHRPGEILNGLLSSTRKIYSVEGTHKLEGTPFPTSDASGYYFRDSTSVVSAVEIMNQGMVWIQPVLPQSNRVGLAAGVSALLLYQNLWRDSQ